MTRSGSTSPPAISSNGRARLLAITGGLSVFPLAVLFLLYFFDEFDTAAFGVLAPNIEHAFSLTDKQFGLVVVLNLTIVLGAAIPIGYLGDRLPRRVLVVAGGVVAGLFSLLTGLVGTVALLFAVRVGNGVGQLVNDPVHNSLLADYYVPDARPRVYGAHRNAVPLGAIFGAAVAGGVSAIAGWRAAFLVLIVPVVLVALVAVRLREPRRGATDDADAAVQVEKERPVPFREAARSLLAVKTLKRQYIAWLFVGAGYIPLAYILPLFLKRAYGLGDLDRGLVTAANAAFIFAGIVVSGRWTQRWLAKEMGEPLRRAGFALVGVGIGLALVAAAPSLPLALGLGFATSFVSGVYFPPFYTVQALVSPARVRTLSFGFGLLFLVAGVWALNFVIGVSNVSDQHGIRWGLGVLGPYFVIGGLVLASARRFVADDVKKAFHILSAQVELRRQRLSAGERTLLLCTALDVAYDSVQVLFDVNLEVADGEIVALLGTNGAGKSTLLKAISGLVDPSGGAVFFDGEDVTHVDARASVSLGMVQMPGGRSIFPTLTVKESLRLAGWMYRRDPAHVKEATARVLDYFPILRERGDTLSGNMSGGEQQMLGLAMALIAKPRLLMIDELSLGLAPTVVAQLVDIVRAINEQGTTIVLVEQSVNVALTLAERAVFMEKGEVRFTGSTAELLERGDILRSVFLEGAASVNGGDPAAPEAGGDRPAVAEPRQLRDVSGRRKQLLGAPPALDVDGLVVRFGGIQAVSDAAFTLRRGEILGLIGPNGAGKTTIFDAISGFVPIARGHIRLGDREITDWAADARARAGLGRSFQDARLFPSMTVAENIAMGLERHLQVRDPVAAALALPAVAEAEAEAAWKVHDLIELLGLAAFRNKFVSELSTGSRRIVDLAMSIAHQPEVLILDEPSSGIAQRETEALGPLLTRIQREVGCALLVIEHDMPLVTGIADSMVALEQGAVIAEGSPDEVVHHPQVVSSYLGTDQEVISRSGARAESETRPSVHAAAPTRPRRRPLVAKRFQSESVDVATPPDGTPRVSRREPSP